MIDNYVIRNVEKYIGEKVLNLTKINIGYSRDVYEINHKYILKIVHDIKKENNTIKEVNFLNNQSFNFIPRIIFSDFSKKNVPYIYYLEEKVDGQLLMNKWKYLNNYEKLYVLKDFLAKIEQIHSLNTTQDNYLSNFINEYDKYLNIIISSNIISNDKIIYLKELKQVIKELFNNAKVGIIHGDLHFNNILINNSNEISIIDFEKLKLSYLEREYDPINRMVRNPNALINNGFKYVEKKEDYCGIIEYIKSNSKDVQKDKFQDRLLLFDCLNSMMWLPKYPEYDVYIDILFNKSKKLLK